jgi:hypothetical protein
MNENSTIMVRTADTTVTRRTGSTHRELRVDDLAENVNQFLSQIESILQRAPDIVGQFEFAEFEVAAEVSANGSLSLLGTGVEVGATGGMTFRFQKEAQASSGT